MEEVSPKPVDTNTFQKYTLGDMDVPLKYFNPSKEKYKRFLTKNNDNKQTLYEKNNGGDSIKSDLSKERGNILSNRTSFALNAHQTAKSCINEKLRALNTTEKFKMNNRNNQQDRKQERPSVPSLQPNIISGINCKLTSKNPLNLLALNKMVKGSTSSLTSTQPLLQRAGYQFNQGPRNISFRNEYIINTNSHTLSHLISREKYEHLKLKAQGAVGVSVFYINVTWLSDLFNMKCAFHK